MQALTLWHPDGKILIDRLNRQLYVCLRLGIAVRVLAFGDVPRAIATIFDLSRILGPGCVDGPLDGVADRRLIGRLVC
jgi:hypothetical protein